MDRQGILLGIGNPLLDIIATVDDDFLQKHDIQLNTSCIAEERHLRVFPELLIDYEPVFVAAGSTQNSIRVAQWMMGIPGLTSYIGCIGKDDFGERLKHHISLDGVNVNYMEHATEATGTCAMLLTSTGERSMIANLAATNQFSPLFLKEKKSIQFLEAAKYIYIAGFFMTENMAALLDVAKYAVEENKIFLMNLSAAYLIQFYQDGVLTVLPYCDYVFCNEAEAALFGDMRGWGRDLNAIALKLSGLPKASGTRPRVVVVTQGGQPTIVAHLGKVTSYAVEPLANELLVDINGAGDAFVGGFVAKLVQGESLGDCVRAGHWIARTVIQHAGCTFPKVCDFV